MNSVGWEFERDVPDVDESELPGEPADVYVRRLALTKAMAVAERHAGEIVLGADTTVVVDGQIVGKPIDLADAKRMIGLLAGRWHEVLTGVAIVRNNRSHVELQRTRVKFAKMTAAEIDLLAEKGDPLDKAGAYAVQAQAALVHRRYRRRLLERRRSSDQPRVPAYLQRRREKTLSIQTKRTGPALACPLIP